MKNDFYVYEWYNIDTNEVFYVGKGRGSRYKNVAQRNNYFKNYYNKYNCNVRKVKIGLEENKAFALEKELITQYKEVNQAKCNIADGGEGCSFQEGSWNDLFRKLQFIHMLGYADGMYNEEDYEPKKLKTKSLEELTDMYEEYIEYRNGLKFYKYSDIQKPCLTGHELKTENEEIVMLTKLIANNIATKHIEFNEFLNYINEIDFYCCDFDTDDFLKLIINNKDYYFEFINIVINNLWFLKYIGNTYDSPIPIKIKSYNIKDNYINIKFNTSDDKTKRRIKINLYDIIWGILMYKNNKALYQIIYEEIFVAPFI